MIEPEVQEMPADLVVQGGMPLSGVVEVRGSKNAVPKLLVAALLADGVLMVENATLVRDTQVVAELLEGCGCSVAIDDGAATIHVDTTAAHPISAEALIRLHKRSRIPILACGPLLSRFGEVAMGSAGGCDIGPRPIDMHLMVLQALGAERDDSDDRLTLRLPTRRFRGASLELAYPSVGATEQFLLASVLADGDSELRNAAIEPEIINLVVLLQRMGALISQLPQRTLRVTGVRQLRSAAIEAIPDRLEAASWASLALASNGRITVHGVQQESLSTFLNTFRRAGGEFHFTPAGTEATFWRERQLLRPLAIETDVHPGFMTDWQPPFATALTQAEGTTVLHETVYEDRLGYLEALKALGANVQTFRECLGPLPCRFRGHNHRHSAVIVGPAKLHGATLSVPDLRAGFAYLVGALCADGESTILGADMLDRGYDRLWIKLRSVGATIREADRASAHGYRPVTPPTATEGD